MKMENVVSGEYIATVNLSISDKATRLARAISDSREAVTATLENESSLQVVKSILLETLQRLTNRDDREALSAAVRKAISRERQRLADVAIQYRDGKLAILDGESEDAAIKRHRRLLWLSDTMTLSLKTATLDKVAVAEKTTESCIPKLPETVANSETVTNSNDGIMLAYWKNRAEKAEAAQLVLAQEIKTLDAKKAEIISQYERANRERGELYREIADLKSRIEEQSEELEKLEKRKPRNRNPKTA
jgi:hypothetical protein